jgi:hypothetical protein
MSNETKTRERFIILLPGFCYYCLGSSFLTSHDYTNIQLRYSSAIAPYTSLYPLQLQSLISLLSLSLIISIHITLSYRSRFNVNTLSIDIEPV